MQLKNQLLDLKIFSIPFSHSRIFFLLGIFAVLVFPYANADVFIPFNEYVGFYDSQGVYTVVGNVKNQNDFALIPTIEVSVLDDNITITKTLNHVPIPSMTDIPFKLKFPEVHDTAPILLNASMNYITTDKDSIPIQILYDKTLMTHEDGHVTGRMTNFGNQTIHNPKIFAIVHGYESILDVTQNINYIEKIQPGQTLNFTMYPDPSVSVPVRYYSCFAPVDTTVIPITTKKKWRQF